jgi:4-deoxy-L-threo-5-hexosulose-uronate ketol-isomerase
MGGTSSPGLDPAFSLRRVRGVDPQFLGTMSSSEIRRSFLVDHLFAPGAVRMARFDQDRAIAGSAVPCGGPLMLNRCDDPNSRLFTDRREIGIINIGAAGIVRVGQEPFRLEKRDGLYVGSGGRMLEFSSMDGSDPASFYFVSYPAHVSHPVQLVRADQAETTRLGRRENSNERTIHKYIHPGGARSCQLMMGLTQLEAGSVWNTMPVHTHERRSEIYLYFDLPKDGVVIHCLGLPSETRHVIVRNRQAISAPGWSIHCGAGTSHYAFIWAMGGENQDFSDMDPIPMEGLA